MWRALDQMTHCYKNKRMTSRGPMIEFFNMIAISALNATIIDKMTKCHLRKEYYSPQFDYGISEDFRRNFT